jgi:uncharacterized protein (TIGR02001 family)
MKKFLLSAAAVAALGAVATPSFAQDVEYSASVALTSNYVYRGITQTDNGPAIQGSFDVTSGGFYAGAWASSVDFGDDTTLEIDLYAGYGGAITEGLSYDVGVIYYAYPDSPEVGGEEQDFFEVYGGLTQDFGAFWAGASVAYSPDFYGTSEESVYTLLSLGTDLTENISADFNYGFSEFDDAGSDDYQDFNFGLSTSAAGFDFDVRYFDTVDLAGADSETVVFTIGKSM